MRPRTRLPCPVFLYSYSLVLLHLTVSMIAFVGPVAGAASSASETVRLHPLADAEVVSNEGSNLMLGSKQTLSVQKGTGRDWESYLKFEVPGHRDDINTVKLKLFVSQIQKGNPQTPIGVWTTDPDWEESSLSYKNRPAPERQVARFSGIPILGAWMEADLTGLIRTGGVYSFRLAAEEKYKVILPSRENADPTIRPILEIAYGSSPPPPDPTTADRAIPSGARSLVRLPTWDVWIDPHSAHPVASALRVSSSSKEAYLSFDLARLNCDITGARLRLYYQGGGREGDAVSLHATANGWTESDLSWETRAPARPAMALAQARLPAQPGWIEFDVLGVMTGTGTYSFIVRTDASSELSFASREATAHAPELAVDYQDGLNKSVPDVFASGERILARYADPRLARDGILDVTQAPYCADPTGKRDSTLAIQRALNDGRDARCVTYLPAGTYLVSDTLEGISPHYQGGGIPGVAFRRREFGCVLKGPADPQQRPILKLADNAPGFSDPDHPKPVIHFWAVIGSPPNVYEKSNAHFSQQIMDIALDLNGARGNAGAIGVEFLACEDSAFQCVAVNATGAFAGVKDGLGSGGAMHDLTVIGGRYGAYLTNTQPTCSLSHSTFTGQTVASVYNRSRGPLVMPGAVIAPGPGAHAIVMDAPPQSFPFNGSVSLIDSRIELPAGSPVPAIAGNRSVYLNNVYAKNAGLLVQIDDARGTQTLRGKSEGWCHVREYAGNATVVFDRLQMPNENPTRTDLLFVDGARREDALIDLAHGPLAESAIPTDLQSRHTWTGIFPYYGTPGILNARDFGATGDGDREEYTDQHPALQQAIDMASARNRPLFLPRGVYRISKTLELRANTVLVGASHVSTLILPIIDPQRFPRGDFLDGKHPQPLIRTVDDSAATTRLGLIGLYVMQHNRSQLPEEAFATTYAVLWQAGRNSVIRVLKSVRPGGRNLAPGNGPFFVFRGNGGGRAFPLKLANSDNMTRQFTNCLIEGTREPLRIYHFQPQGASEGDCGAAFRNARNVDVFGTKYEGSRPVGHLRDSRQIRIFGEGGGGAPRALFRLEDCQDVLLTNLYPQRGKVLLGSRSHVSDGALETGDLNQVLLYKRGNPHPLE